MKTLFGIAILLICIHNISSLKCMSCTYTFSGSTGIYDRECVSAVRNFTKTSVIQCSDFCLTRAVYVTGYTRLNSLYRGCGYHRQHYCENPRSLVPSCELSCKTDECNDGNGDLWERLKPHPHPHPNPGGAQSLTGRMSYLIVVALFCFGLGFQ